MLKELTDICAVSSFEDSLRSYIISKVEKNCDKISTDIMGNLLCFKKGRKQGKTIMMSAHMDEVGLLVRDFTDDGYIKFSGIGIDPRILLGTRVVVGDSHIPGVIGIKAVHMTTAEERKTAVTEKDMYIDIGASSAEEAKEKVSKGDMIAFDSDYTEFGDGKIKAKALDDRVGCFALINLLNNADFEYDTWCVFTVQEEVGLRGGYVAGKSIAPDIFVALEATTCSDLPDVPPQNAVTSMGKGVALSYMDGGYVQDKALVDAILNLAKTKNIPCQLKSVAAGGNEVRSVQVSAKGVRSVALSVPCRYLHSPVSVIDKKDLDALVALSGEIAENFSLLEVI